MVDEKIIITSEYRDLTRGGLLKTIDSVRELRGTTEKIITTTNTFTKKTQKLTQNIKEITGKVKPFRMELLSVMFGAAALSASLFGMLQPSLDIVDVFDILKDTLAVTFLPTALKVQDWALSFMQTMIDLPEPIRSGIGDSALLTGGFLAVLALESQLGLFWDGLIIKTGIMQGSVLNVNNALQLLSKALIIPLVLKGFDEIKTNETIAAFSNFLLAAGFLMKTGTIKNIVLGASLVLSAADRIAWGKHTTFLDYLKDSAIGGYIGWQIGGIWGAGLGVAATLFINTIFSDTGGVLGEKKPIIPEIVSPSQQPADIPRFMAPDFSINSNVNISTQPNIVINWDEILPEIIRKTNETITNQVRGLSRVT